MRFLKIVQKVAIEVSGLRSRLHNDFSDSSALFGLWIPRKRQVGRRHLSSTCDHYLDLTDSKELEEEEAKNTPRTLVSDNLGYRVHSADNIFHGHISNGDQGHAVDTVQAHKLVVAPK